MFKKEKESAKPAPEVKVVETKGPDQKPAQTQPAAKQEAKASKPQGLSQREAVFLAVMSCFERNNVKFNGGKAGDLLNPEMRKQVTDSLCADFKAGKISLRETPANKEKLSDEKELRVYTTGLINNWLRRDKRLNGSSAQ